MISSPAIEALDLAIYPMLYRMTHRGLRVDRDALQRLGVEVEVQMAEQLAALERAVGHPINPNSGVQVAAWMEEEGFTGKLTRGKDRLSTSERDLKLHVSPAIDAVLEYRGLQKLKSSYIEPCLGFSAHDGRIHPRWKPTRVPSGRLACGRSKPGKDYPIWESPNLMAFPARDELGKRLRACFLPDDGFTMFSIDYSQIEPRLAAALSQDPELCRIYREGRDIYTEVAIALFGVQPPPGNGELADWKLQYRLPAKIVTLGVFYGMGPRKLYEELLRWGCGTPDAPTFDEEACADLIARWFARYTGVRDLVNTTCWQARAADGWAMTYGGRGRFLPALMLEGRWYPESKLREEAERQAFNHLVQGTAQEYMKRGMLRVEPVADAGGFEPLLQIHDELVGQVPTRDEGIVPALARMMEAEHGGIVLKTGWTTGGDWGALKS